MIGGTFPTVSMTLARRLVNGSASGVVPRTLNGQRLTAAGERWPEIRRTLATLKLRGEFGREYIECRRTAPGETDTGDSVVRAWRMRGDPDAMYGFIAVHDKSLDLVGVEVGTYRVDRSTFRAGSADLPSCA